MATKKRIAEIQNLMQALQEKSSSMLNSEPEQTVAVATTRVNNQLATSVAKNSNNSVVTLEFSIEI